MRTVTPQQLNAAYMELYPAEIRPEHAAESERILANWLERYNEDPVRAVAMSNWYGKVTRALLKALGSPMPKSKRHALFMLAGQ